MNIKLSDFAYIYDYRNDPVTSAQSRENDALLPPWLQVQSAKRTAKNKSLPSNPPETRFLIDGEEDKSRVIYGMCFEEPRDIGDIVVELEEDFPTFAGIAALQTYAPDIHWKASLTWTWHQGQWEYYHGYPRMIDPKTFVYPAKLLKTSKLRFVKAMPIDLSSVRIKSVSVYGIPEYTDCSLIVSTGLWGHEAGPLNFSIYNGEILSADRISDTTAALKLHITRKPYDKSVRTDPDRTILTVSVIEDGAPSMVSFLPAELDTEPYICIPDFGVLAYTNEKKLPAGIFDQVIHTGEKIRDRVKKAPQRTFEMTEKDIGLKPVTKMPETEKFTHISSEAKIRIPDKRMEKQWEIGLSHLMTFCNQEEDGKWNVKIGPYPMIATESVPITKMLDFYGRSDVSRGAYEKFLETYSERMPEGLFQTKDGCLCTRYGIYPEDSWMGMDPPAILIGISEHYLVTRDGEWLRKAADKMFGCCDWILKEIALYKETAKGAWDEGLLPPVIHTDINDWFSSYAWNSMYYKGLDLSLKTIASLGGEYAVKAEKRRPAAENFRLAVRRAYSRGVRLSPAVKLRDGTYAPGLAAVCYMRGLMSDIYPYSPTIGLRNAWLDLDFSAQIIDAGIFGPHEKESNWVLDCLEDRVMLDPFLMPKKWDAVRDCPVTFGRDTTCMETDFSAERDWYAWGGTGWQNGYCAVAQAYAMTGEINAYIRTCYNTYAIHADPETYWLREHAGSLQYPPKTHEEGVMILKLRSFLIHEAHDELNLCSFTPDAWFAEGFEVENAPTFYGKISFRLTPNDDSAEVLIKLDKTAVPKRIRLRVANAKGREIGTVRINGSLCDETNIDRHKSTVILNAALQEWHVEVSYQ